MTHRDAFLSRWTHLFQHQEFEEFVESTDSLLRGHVTEDCESIAQKDKELSDLKAVLAQKDEALREWDGWFDELHKAYDNAEVQDDESYIGLHGFICSGEGIDKRAKAALSAAPRDETCATCGGEGHCFNMYVNPEGDHRVNCRDCKGTGKKPCPDCKATEGE